ncbi:hypothetical protein [Pikeienuella sp. HZG-20]|uniref:hypothetical protein n=1 Tax=Paludibacillus litoralis TaxID=3133267 RepID=UPI0030ECB45F
MDDLLKIVIGAAAGGVIGPIILEHYRSWRREREWERPRKALLMKLLSGPLVFRSLDILSRTTGTTHEECRSLLIALDARGGLLSDGREAWALIARAPLKDADDPELIERNRTQSGGEDTEEE